jgi:hypothetical protein
MHVRIQAEIILNSDEQVTKIAELTQQLAQATLPRNQSLLPNDLQTSSEILSTIVDVLESNNVTNNVRIIIANGYVFTQNTNFVIITISVPCAQNVIDVFNNILDDSNREGWRVLQTVSTSVHKF